MKLDFDINFIREHKISLLDCQVDLILKSLELYGYTFKYVCPKKKYEDREDELRISLVRDTYHQILAQYCESKKEQEIIEDNERKVFIKKVL